MAAFRTKLMLLDQFPMPAIRKQLRATLREKAIGDVRDPHWAVLVVCDNTGEIISLAKWRRPIPDSEWDRYVEVPWKWPDSMFWRHGR